jgi:hypothetical protein
MPDSAEFRADLSATAGPETIATLLSAGYHLRMLNALRKHFGGRAELSLLATILWLEARQAGGDPPLPRAAAEVLLGLGLRPEPGVTSLSLRSIEAATGFARETLRRHARQLEAQGWLAPGATQGRVPTARLDAWFEDPRQSEQMRDLRWTAACVDEVLTGAPDALAAALPGALAAMRACRADELPLSLTWPEPPPPTDPRAARAVQLRMHGYNLRHLLRLGRAFDGDLLLPVVLGEIGHRNIASLGSPDARNADELAVTHNSNRLRVAIDEGSLLASNAHSLALCLEVPYESMRRKLATLRARDWVAPDRRGLYAVQPHVEAQFREFNRTSFADLRATARAIERALRPAAR